MNQTCDAVVVGGGVIGLLTARELHAAGLRVTVLERGRIGKASSQAGGGILSPIPPWDAPSAVTVLANRSNTLYPTLATSLMQSTGVDIEYRNSGVLLLGERRSAAAVSWAKEAGQEIKELNASQLARLEPQLNAGWHDSVFMPGLGQLRNPRLTYALQLALHENGVSLHEQTPVVGFTIDRNRVTGVKTAAGEFQAQHVIVAAGAWTSELLGALTTIEIEPVRGQMLWYQLEPGVFNSVIIANEEYLIPRRDGVCLVGSTVEHVGFDNTTTTRAAKQLTAVACRLSPVFEDRKPAGQWSGLRPGSIDGIPTISAHPELAGLFIHAGHYRNGINLGPASAGLMADIVLGREPILDPGPYLSRNHL